jgi:hypothetical protein
VFDDAEKTDIRRYMGYPMFGDEATQGFGHRFLHHWGLVEYRMNHALPAEEAVIRDHLTKLKQLETDTFDVRGNLDTASAAVWTRNEAEQAERERLYRTWRLRLCQFFGVPGGPGLQGGNTVCLKV